MNECYSFRQLPSEKAHDHRLMYLHSTISPIHFPYNSCSRKRIIQNECEGENSTCGSLKNKIQKHLSCRDKHFNTAPIRRVQSQKKIKYFKLNLTKLISSNQLDSSNCSHFNETDHQYIKKGHLDSFLNHLDSKKEHPNKDDSIYTNKLSEILNQIDSTSKGMEKICNNNLKELNNTYSGGKMIQNIKANTKNANINDINGKQNIMKNHYAHKHPKIIKPAHFFRKSTKRSQIRQQLQLKRLQKIVVDKSGHQFRIIIQKIK